MCLVALALDQSSRFPLVLAGNREEFFDRSSARLEWWDPEHGGPAILGGRDLHAGGTWLGLTAQGRMGVLTNVRAPEQMDPNAPTRGEIVPLWLRGNQSMDQLWPQLAMTGYNGFNLLALDFSDGEAFWVNNTHRYPQRLQRGLYGLSNADLNTPWPKVQALKDRLQEALTDSRDLQGLEARLFAALTDPRPASDDKLPSTGISLDWERLLSPAMVRSADGRYGTRCSTLIITERVNKRLQTHVLERTYSGRSEVALLRRVTLENWPPRHSAVPAERFESGKVSEHDNHALPVVASSKIPSSSLIKTIGTRSVRA
ncbi:MAG: NRDE family protein [Burkholderiales bacterium]|nr:NRDE family protein [Burkholderiales bacterium]